MYNPFWITISNNSTDTHYVNYKSLMVTVIHINNISFEILMFFLLISEEMLCILHNTTYLLN